jgi:predicted O-linked N-acetylglucosamine transferase (SPINDLY family)
VYSRAECGLPANINDGAVFACFNNSYKIEPFIFEAWLAILEKCPGSVLWLFSHNELCQKNLLSLAIERGISGERLIFAEDLPKPEHLARLSIADLALDTGIYGGHTTTADNLLVGVPTIAIEGSHFASRASNSILCALGLAELVCPDLTAYKVLAQHLALDVNALATLKEKIKINKNIYPLFDAKFYMKNFENNLEKIFAMWLRGHDLDHVGND